MKEIVILLLVIVALVAGVWIFMAHYLPGPPAYTMETKGSPGSTPLALPKIVTKQSHLRAPRVRHGTVEPPELTPEPAAVVQIEAAVVEHPVEPQEAAVSRPLAPAVFRAVQAGMEEEDVVRLLGKPLLTTLTSQGGSRVENLVYTQTKGWPQVVIHLSDGKVVGPPQ